jgi:hypothetical protein
MLDTFAIIVLGDSIQWGQGLEPDQKTHSLVTQKIMEME